MNRKIEKDPIHWDSSFANFEFWNHWFFENITTPLIGNQRSVVVWPISVISYKPYVQYQQPALYSVYKVRLRNRSSCHFTTEIKFRAISLLVLSSAKSWPVENSSKSKVRTKSQTIAVLSFICHPHNQISCGHEKRFQSCSRVKWRNVKRYQCVKKFLLSN